MSKSFKNKVSKIPPPGDKLLKQIDALDGFIKKLLAENRALKSEIALLQAEIAEAKNG